MDSPGRWKEHFYLFKVLEATVDSNGHMHNVAYLAAFEEARWEMVTDRGYGIEYAVKARAAPIVLDIRMRFKKEVFLRETVTIKTSVISYRGKVMKVQQLMLSSEGDIRCLAVFTIGLFDTGSRKMLFPTKEWLFAWGLMTV